MTGGEKHENQIKRSKTIKSLNTRAEEKLDAIKRASTMKQKGHPDINTDLFGKDAHKEKNKPEILTELKEKAESIPVLVPDVKDILRELHANLAAEEETSFSKVMQGQIHRNRYDSLSASDIKKRAKAAVKRRENAQKIMEYDAARADAVMEYTHIDQETLKKHLASFKKLPSKPYDLDTDEKFVANLEKNYQLCEAADRMKHWLREASDQGFMPKGEDMKALQEKIATFEEVKRYMDVQKDLMKNPYYQYFAKNDISYTDSQLGHFSKYSKDPILKNYLQNVQSLRSLKFVRSKGMKSAEKTVKEQGKREAEILATKQEKRLLIDILTDKALHMTGNQRFLDRDYDARFSPEKFRNALKNFNALNFKDLHFAGVKDMVQHFDENQLIFDQAHDMEHLMMVAVNRGLAPSEQEMLKFRAKMETLLQAERMVAHVHKNVLSDTEAFLHEKTYGDLEEAGRKLVKDEADSQYRHEPPKFGEDLNRYFRSLVMTYQQEHKDREKKIKLVYGMTHPERLKEGKNQGKLVPGQIPEKELKRRSEDFQKNLFRGDYMRNLETYIQDVYGTKMEAVAAAHANRTGRQRFTGFGRTLTPYLTGRNAAEITRVIDIMQVGTAKEKEQLFREVAEEAFQTDLCDFDTKDSNRFYQNAAARARMAKIINNLGGSTGEAQHHIKDAELMKKIEGYYETDCGQDFSSAFSQGVRGIGRTGFWYEDLFFEDSDAVEELTRQTEDEIEEQSDQGMQGEIRIGDETYNMSLKEYNSLTKTLDRIDFMKKSGYSRLHPEREGKRQRDTAPAMLYDMLKVSGYHKAVTNEEVDELKEYYRAYDEKYVASGTALVSETKKKLKKEFPEIEKSKSKRTWILSNMTLLARSRYGKDQAEKKAENKEEQFTEAELERSASLFKGLLIYNDRSVAPARQERARAIEEMFRTIMDFDISRLSFRTYSDLIKAGENDPDRFKECHAVTRLAVEAVNYISDYKKLRNDEEVSCRLNAVHVDEIAARCDLLMSAEVFFDGNFLKVMESPELKASGIPLDDLLHLLPEELDEKLTEAIKTGDQNKITFWTNVRNIAFQLEGFDIGVPATVVEEHFRKKKGLLERSRAMETKNILDQAKRVLDDKKPGDVKFECGNETAFERRFSKADRDRKSVV